jgi:hypothetical protein
LLSAVELEDSLAKKDSIANLPKFLHTTQPLAMTKKHDLQKHQILKASIDQPK